jgi:AcrR family transcriptional regulator
VPTSNASSPALPPGRTDLARTRLFQAAVEVFGQKGPKAATVRDIARAAGQNVAAIAYYFGSKDQLYRAVIEELARQIRSELSQVLDRIEQFRASPAHRPDQAVALLQEFLRTIYLRLLSRDEAAALARLIVREQTQPTPAFEILYEQLFRHVHETLCYLVAAALEQSPRSPEILIRTHTLMGQVFFFAVSRETILRRLGWKSLEGPKAEKVASIISQNVAVLLHGLSGKPHGPNSAGL